MHKIHEEPKQEPIKIDSADIEIKEGYIVTIKRGDILVLEGADTISREGAERLGKRVVRLLPEGCGCILLESGLVVAGIIRREDEANNP